MKLTRGPYNVSFTIRNVKADSFYLYCWLYAGFVSFKEANQVTLEFSSELLSIDNYQYYLYKPGQQAQLYKITEVKGEVRIPSTVSYEGKDYTVTSFNPEGFIGREMTKLFFPKTIRSMGNDEFINLFNARQPLLEAFEVEPGCPLLSSIDGVLYSSDHKTLYCLPVGKNLKEYTVVDGVEKISIYAFGNCPNLKTIRLPESMTTIRPSAFYKCNNLEAIYIFGKLNRNGIYLAFLDMNSTPTLYVPDEEVEYYKTIYKGPVLPISTENETENDDYHPFVEEGKVWKVGIVSGNPVQVVDYYYFDGDTIINGKTCKQMMCEQFVNPDYADYDYVMRYPQLSYVGAWYEEDKKVYFYNANNKRFTLWYDFSADANDTIQILGQSYVIGSKQTGGMKGFKGVYRDVMMVWDEEQNNYNTTWLEGVGCIDGPTVGVYLGEENHTMFLMSCTVGDEVIYFNDEYEDGATPDEMNARKQRIDFTHTVKIRPKAPMKRAEEQSLYGEYNERQLGINLNPLDEAYLVRITDESGKTFYEKTVNAGSIVGLNIDISAYAKGRYIVTVENSQESFTGVFDAQTQGIEENVRVEKANNASIYNLHGQRISTLQKGLNIVNGQKVYVK